MIWSRGSVDPAFCQVVNVDFYIKSVCKTGEEDDNEAARRVSCGQIAQQQGSGFVGATMFKACFFFPGKLRIWGYII